MSMNVTYALAALMLLGGAILCLSIVVWFRQFKTLHGLASIRATQEDFRREHELLSQRIDEHLKEIQIGTYRELAESRNYIVERLIRSHHLHQKSGHELQQQLLNRFGNLYQALERRFGEMQKDLTEDAGRLRTDLLERFESLQKTTSGLLSDGSLAQQKSLGEVREGLQESLNRHRQHMEERHGDALRMQQETLRQGMETVTRQVGEALSRHAEVLGSRVADLTSVTDRRLRDIGDEVEKRLDEGFKKTTETFTQVLNHLTRIDEAQKKITELSSNVVSLQEVLSDKRSRGAFGEVQLHALIRNLMPESSFSLQHVLGNDNRVDCMLFLPDPTGNIGIDAKFPLESFRHMTNLSASDVRRDRAARQFRVDIRRHIRAIAEKYIVPGETAEGAVMFIPAEAVFAEIHARFPELVEESYRLKVWMVSPTTMMAILTTARSVLKDAATREQVDIIQEHLRELGQDFGRFQQRMDNLARHIHQAGRDVEEINVSARKISGRFEKIERVELEDQSSTPLPVFKETPALETPG